MSQDNQPKIQAAQLKQITDQFEDIMQYYQGLLDQANKEKEDALTEADLAKAKVKSLEAERDSLAQSLRDRGQKDLSAAEAEDKQQIEALTAERDQLKATLKSADERMRGLEAELAALRTQGQQEAVTPVRPEPVEPAVIPTPETTGAAAPVEVQPVTPADDTPQPDAAPSPDFEGQKEALRRMEEELAKLEERLRRNS